MAEGAEEPWHHVMADDEVLYQGQSREEAQHVLSAALRNPDYGPSALNHLVDGRLCISFGPRLDQCGQASKPRNV